ncbi:MAG: hypothetical protein AB1568_16170 [Thermodesulfobacteriota bacterium]
MKKVTVFATTLLLSGLLAAAPGVNAAESSAPPPAAGQDATAQEEMIMVESNVSQAQVDLVVKQQDRRRQVEEARKIRAATIEAARQQ